MFGNKEKGETTPSPAPRSTKQTSVLGQGTSFNGTLRVQGALTIEGEFEGSIECSGHLTVGRSGRVKADLDVQSATIGGNVEGSVQAKERVELQTGSVLLGDVHARSFVIQDDCQFQGRCVMGKAAGASKPEAPEGKPDLGILKQS